MIRLVKNKAAILRADRHLWEVLQGASSSLLIQILGAVLGFVTSVVIARILGAGGAGVYYLALSIATIAATVGRMGFDNTIVRFIALHSSVHEWAAVRFVYRTALKIVAVSSLLIAVALFLSADWIATTLFGKSEMLVPLRLVSISVLPLSLTIIHAESLRGLKKIRATQLINNVLISFGTVLLLYPFVHSWGANGAVAAYVTAVIVSSGIAWLLWQRTWQDLCCAASHEVEERPIKVLIQSSWPMYGVALTNLVIMQAATIFIGVWCTSADIGIFNVANRVSSLLLFPLLAMVSILAPKFSAMYRQNDIKGITRLTWASTRALTFFSVSAGLLTALFSDQIMSIFGAAFRSGGSVLDILIVGVVINAASGPVGNVLMMTGHEADVRNATAGSALITFGFLMVLVPTHGANGAAIALASGMVLQNILMVIMVKKLLGFWPLRLTKDTI